MPLSTKRQLPDAAVVNQLHMSLTYVTCADAHKRIAGPTPLPQRPFRCLSLCCSGTLLLIFLFLLLLFVCFSTEQQPLGAVVVRTPIKRSNNTSYLPSMLYPQVPKMPPTPAAATFACPAGIDSPPDPHHQTAASWCCCSAGPRRTRAASSTSPTPHTIRTLPC